MIKRLVMVTLLVLTAALLQTALMPFVSLEGFRPDLLLLVTVAFALREGPEVGARIGFVSGLTADLLLNHSAVGLNALVLLGVGYVIGVSRRYVARESVTAPLLLAFVASLLGAAGYALLARLLGDERFTLALVLQSSIFVALYNTLLAPVVVGVVTRLIERFPAEAASVLGLAR